jgi:hypothetical protein
MEKQHPAKRLCHKMTERTPSPKKGQQGFQRVVSQNDNTRTRTDLLSQNDKSGEPHNTQKAIAKSGGVSTGHAK